MNIPCILEEKNRVNGWENERAAVLADMSIKRYSDIFNGLVKPNYEDALKLSDLYEIPSYLFLSDETTATHINSAQGTFSNSNHGYIQTVTNNTDSGLRDLVKELITIIKSDRVWPQKKDN